MTDLIVRALANAGYDDDPTVENLVRCFLDYVDCGVFGNLDYEEAKEEIGEGSITVEDMCRNLIKL